MTRCLSLGIDIGSEFIRFAVAEKTDRGDVIRAKASVKTAGISQGKISSRKDFTASLEKGLTAISKSFPAEKVWEANVGFAAGIKTNHTNTSTIVTHGSGEVTELDIQRGIDKAITKLKIVNSKLIYTEIISYSLDGKKVENTPIGLRGKKLEMDLLFVMIPRQTITQLDQIFDDLDIDIIGITAGPLVEAPLVTTELERIAGVMAVNIGSQLTTATVYENGILRETAVFEFGSNDITESLALALKISLEEAEAIKTKGSQNKTVAKKRELVVNKQYKKLFADLNILLQKIKRKKLLPAGVIFSGGGSLFDGLEELAKSELELPAKKASVRIVKKELDKRELPWATAYGLALDGLNSISASQFRIGKLFTPIKNLLKNFFI